MVGAIQALDRRTAASNQFDRCDLRADVGRHLGADCFMVVICGQAFATRADKGAHNSAERAKSALDLAHVVEQRAGDFGHGCIGPILDEALSYRDAVAAILIAELHPERPLPLGQVIICPYLVGNRWWGSGQRRDEASNQVPPLDRVQQHRRHQCSVARGWLDRYTSHRRSWLTRVYTWVVEIDA